MSVTDNFELERSNRLESIRLNGDGAFGSFRKTILSTRFLGNIEKISCALDFSFELEYDHAGLTKEAYLAHPIRVATILSDVLGPAKHEDVVIALLHNVYEVGNTSKDLIVKNFGPIIEGSIANLTVNRKIQWDQQYKDRYYQQLRDGYAGACRVKVVDKLDNIFLINLNSDEEIRKQYLDEIVKYVIPMAADFVPKVQPIFEKAVEWAISGGFRPAEKR